MDRIDIPLAIPQIMSEERDAIMEVLESGWLTHGDYNRRLEETFARYIGVQQAITMNSGASALEVALKVHGIRGTVIVPGFTFVASANAIVNAGATPVFCDVDLGTRNVTAEHIASCIQSSTEAVMVVHFGGQPCAMDGIKELCEKRGLLLIEDSAQTLGATWQGKQAGGFGIGCFSFFPTKNMTTGEGGMLTCDNDDLSDVVRTIIAHGIPASTSARERIDKPWLRLATMAGHNYRMSNILAALGYHQLKRVDEMNRKRQLIAERYTMGIQHMNLQVRPPELGEGATHVYQMYTVLADSMYRDNWVQGLRRRGIGASVHFDPPVHLQPFYKECYPTQEPLVNTELLARTIITLPMYPQLSIERVDRVLQEMKSVMMPLRSSTSPVP